jgi:peroxiredoxin
MKGEKMVFLREIRMLVILLLLFGLLVAPAPAVQKGKDYGNLSFPAVLSEHDQKYLGLSSTGAFKLENIGAPYVVLEIMRSSCPHCQEQVPGMNSFFNLVQNSDLKGKVRFLAVAQGCSADEAKNFKKRHKVAFPVLADPKGTVGGALGISGVPTTVIMNRNGQALRVHVGDIGSPKKALAELRGLVK